MGQERDSLDLAYELSMKAYDLAERRFDAMDRRIQGLMTLASALILALAALVTALELDLHPIFLVSAGSALLAALVVGAFVRLTGEFTMVHPSKLHRAYLDYSEQEFRKHTIRNAGQHLDSNKKIIKHKRNLAAAMSILLLVAFLLAVAGIFLSR